MAIAEKKVIFIEQSSVKSSRGEVHVFATYELAKEKLNEWFLPEQIVSGQRLISPMMLTRE